MEYKKYKIVLYLIIFTILSTVAVQIFWNYKNYKGNKHRIYNEMRRALDNSIEDYYANITRSGFITFSSSDSLLPIDNDTIFMDKSFRFDMRKKIDSTFQKIIKNDTNRAFILESKQNRFSHFPANSERFKSIDSLISKIYISISRDNINLDSLNQYLIVNLKRKDLPLDYGLLYKNKIPFTDETISQTFNNNIIKDTVEGHRKVLKIQSKSNFISRGATLELYFKNISLAALKKTSSGILISVLLITAVFLSLLYLLKVIKKQKQLAEIKDDLISNITHELKTPITTISAALQALQSFHALDDKEKTKKYLEVSHGQVDKLQLMVEKILETATLDSNKLHLEQESVNVNHLLSDMVNRYKIAYSDKHFDFKSNLDDVIIKGDNFHLENALNNILDNAVKYGGNKISVTIKSIDKAIEITIRDNGNGIDKKQQQKIFDKFYRIPTGNIHNVKGFGIGLYYAKHIIEKHQGTITLTSEKNTHTTFNIILPEA